MSPLGSGHETAYLRVTANIHEPGDRHPDRIAKLSDHCRRRHFMPFALEQHPVMAPEYLVVDRVAVSDTTAWCAATIEDLSEPLLLLIIQVVAVELTMILSMRNR